MFRACGGRAPKGACPCPSGCSLAGVMGPCGQCLWARFVLTLVDLEGTNPDAGSPLSPEALEMDEMQLSCGVIARGAYDRGGARVVKGAGCSAWV